MRPWFVVVCLAAAACFGSKTPTAPTTLPSLAAAAEHGGVVIFFRHAARDASAIANDALLEADRTGSCVPGAELTPQGIDDAVAIGQAFKRRGIRIDRVVASPTCRTQQMATLAFGAHETTPALAWPEVWAPDEADALQAQLPRLLSTPPRTGTVTVLISHSGVLIPTRMGLDIMLDQAEAALFHPVGDGAFDYLGKVAKGDW